MHAEIISNEGCSRFELHNDDFFLPKAGVVSVSDNTIKGPRQISIKPCLQI